MEITHPLFQTGGGETTGNKKMRSKSSETKGLGRSSGRCKQTYREEKRKAKGKESKVVTYVEKTSMAKACEE
jgi:hypothetical protein